MSTSEQYRICGLYEDDKLLYLGRADTIPSRWGYNIKTRYDTEVGRYMRQYPEKKFRVRTLASYKRNGMRDKAFKDYYYDLNPVFPNGYVKS